MFSGDTLSACLQALTSENHCVTCGPKFGIEHEGKKSLVVRDICGGKAVGTDFRNHLRSGMIFLDFKPCLADPEAWMIPSIKACDAKHYETVLLYVEDALVTSKNDEKV